MQHDVLLNVRHCVFIGVIYRGTRGTGTPQSKKWGLFGLRGTVPSTFQDEKVKNLLSPAVNRGDLQSLNYNKKPFSARDAPQTPAGRAHDSLPDPRVG